MRRNLGDIAEGPRWREVDGLGVVERVIDLVAIEEGVDQPAAGFWLHGEEGCRVPDAGQDDLLDVRQVGEEFLRGGLRQEELAVRDLGVRLPQ